MSTTADQNERRGLRFFGAVYKDTASTFQSRKKPRIPFTIEPRCTNWFVVVYIYRTFFGNVEFLEILVLSMGKGDKRTRKGKRVNGSYGKARPKKNKKKKKG